MQSRVQVQEPIPREETEVIAERCYELMSRVGNLMDGYHRSPTDPSDPTIFLPTTENRGRAMKDLDHNGATKFLSVMMDQRMNDVIQLCSKIADQPKFKDTWKNTRKGMSITAAGAGLGGLLLGPPGFAVGGAVGGLLAWWTSEQFKSLPKILKEMPPAEKQKLYNDVVAVLGNLTWTNAPQLIAMVMGNTEFKQRVTGVLLNYIKKNVCEELRDQDGLSRTSPG